MSSPGMQESANSDVTFNRGGSASPTLSMTSPASISSKNTNAEIPSWGSVPELLQERRHRSRRKILFIHPHCARRDVSLFLVSVCFCRCTLD
ncbi:hypothetical protein TNIN_483341 [Trichonephila inaurata madagascariensis]|uniref:Uncharacterized protein n=1 Tax=Trichonephila inaurata madagascariensis TaxID=2747483 RepID=A0A8X6YQF1_9ARAC|nr:hypothetical protein TNIN_483341 [Trichonephila inaurata madagascariensis]